MGFKSGKTGYVIIQSGEYAFDKWDLKVTTKAVSTNNFTSEGFDDNVAGFSGFEVTVSGPWEVGAEPVTSGEVYEFHLGVDEGIEWSGNARVTEVGPSDEAEGTPRLSIKAKSKGVFSLDFDGGLAGIGG